MKKLIPLLLLVIVLFACKKEDNNIIWERSLGLGNAFFVESTGDSGFLSCGTISGRPYLVKFSKIKGIDADYSSEREGLFSSAWSDTSCIIASGSSNGKMLLARIDLNGYKVWDTTIIASFYLDLTKVISMGDDGFIAVGSASPDSSGNGDTKIMIVRFDATGLITEKKETSGSGFISATSATIDTQGNFYLPLTRKSGSQKPKASVAKYNNDFQKLWETELYNNPDFAAACCDVAIGGSGNIFVTGWIEAVKPEGTINNSYIASITNAGEIEWKKYLENANSGSAVILDDNEGVVMMNRNCFIIRKADGVDGSDAGTIRMYNECDSQTTDAFCSDMNYNYDGNFLAAGSVGGNFYLAIKSSQ